MIEATTKIHHSDVRDHYNDLDVLYRSIWGRHLHHGYWSSGREDITQATHQLIQKIAICGGFQRGESLLDIGCGYGETAKVLAEQFKAKVTGITITPRQYELARLLKPKAGSLNFHLGDWLENKISSGRFERAYAVESSEHVTNKSKFFQEASRILKPGGTFTVCAWVAADEPYGWQKRMFLVPICNEGRLPALETAEEYNQLFRSNGMKVFHVEDISRQVRKTWALVLQRTMLRFGQNPKEVISGIKTRSGDFLLTPFRMWAAFHTGALRYLVIAGRKI